ncbi:hypothetical protein ScPMuIL_013909 [Solemya velum]
MDTIEGDPNFLDTESNLSVWHSGIADSVLDFASALRGCTTIDHDEEEDDLETVPTLNILHVSYEIKERIGPWWKGFCFRQKRSRTVLNDVSFKFPIGELTGILGSSGSGKTSLLDVISCRTEGVVNGDIFYKNYACTKYFMRQFGSYVMQADRLLPNLTVRETLRYSAQLRLSGSATPDEIDTEVANVISHMGLRTVADTRIGGSMKRGLSGGEKRRVTIAIQLLQEPKILLLDEPTSGLDSYTARSLVSNLAGLAHQGKAVILTIHQPRSDIYKLFDNVGILSMGQVVYYGKSNEMVSYFTGIEDPCPQYANPLDYYVDKASVDRRNLESELKTTKKVEHLISLYKQSKIHQEIVQDIAGTLSRYPAVVTTFTSRRQKPSFLYVLKCLVSRLMVNLSRDRTGYLSRIFLMVVFVPFVCIFLGRLKDNQQSVQDRIGLLYQGSQIPYYMGILHPVALFPPLRELYYRECRDGLYSTTAFLLAYITHALPFQFMSSLIFSTVIYWVTGMHPSLDRFCIYTAIVTILHFCGEVVTLGIMAIFMNPHLANSISAVILTTSGLIASGFIRSLGSMLDVFHWLSWATLHKYCSEILVVNEFHNLNFTCSHQGRAPCLFPTGDAYLDKFYSGAVDHMERNFGALAGFAIGYVVLTILTFKIKGIPNLH